MTWDYRRYPFCPADDALDLLRAALHPDPQQALTCWQRWRAVNTLEDCDLKMHRLMPLLYRRFQHGGLAPEDHRILRGVYRYNWTRNQLVLRQAQSVIEHLENNGVPTLLLKGLPLLITTYKDLGVRPMWDFDVLVHPEQQRQAVELLQPLGWTSPHPCPSLHAGHAHELVSPQGQALDLHWFGAHASQWPEADADFWSHSVQLSLSRPDRPQGAITARCLCPEHNLLHVCMHGARSNSNQDLGWVCDACQILERHSLDWDLVIAGARHHRVVPTLSLALSYLATKVQAAVPPQVLQRLHSMPISWPDRVYFQCAVRGAPLNIIGLPCFDYLRLEGQPTVSGFLEYLRRRWSLSSWAQLPISALHRTLQHLTRWLRGRQSDRSGEARLTTKLARLRRSQEMAQRKFPSEPGVSLAAELIADRRREAEQD